MYKKRTTIIPVLVLALLCGSILMQSCSSKEGSVKKRDRVEEASIYNISEETLLKRAKQAGVERFTVGVVVKNDSNKTLLLKRKQDDFMGGIWELPGGEVEANESLYQASKRELTEETGIENSEIIEYVGSFDYSSKSGKKTRQFTFHMSASIPDRIVHPEHEDYRWAHPEELAQIPDLTEEVLNILKVITAQ